MKTGKVVDSALAAIVIVLAALIVGTGCGGDSNTTNVLPDPNGGSNVTSNVTVIDVTASGSSTVFVALGVTVPVPVTASTNARPTVSSEQLLVTVRAEDNSTVYLVYGSDAEALQALAALRAADLMVQLEEAEETED